MIADVALPEPTDPDEPVVVFVQVECRCGEKPSVAHDPLSDDSSTAADGWHSVHFDATGHRRFYRWRLERDTGSMYLL